MKYPDAVATEIHELNELIGQQIRALTQELTPESATAYIERKQRITDLVQTLSEKPMVN
jgi:hypothetical protein